MNLTLLTHRFLPRYFGGVETYTLRLAQALQKRGHQVQALTDQMAKRDSQLNSIYRTKVWRLARKLWGIRQGSINRARNWYRSTVPFKWRIWFRYLRHPEERPQREVAKTKTIPAPLNQKPTIVRNFGVGKPGLVSVVLPVYNQANLLSASIESVLVQTYESLELIIVKDDSTDNVEPILDKFVHHPKARILTQTTNQKLSHALNNGFDFATGEYVAWTSADNIMNPTAIERMVGFLNQHPEVAMVYTDYQVIDENGFPLRNQAFRPHNQDKNDPSLIRLPRSTENLNLVKDNFIGACFLYRAWVARIIGDYDPYAFGAEDYDYWMRINNLFTIAHIGTDEILCQYRVHDNTLNAQANELGIHDTVNQLMEYEKKRQEFISLPLHLFGTPDNVQLLTGKLPDSIHLVTWNSDNLPGDGNLKCGFIISENSLAQLREHKVSAKNCMLMLWLSGDSDAPYLHHDVLREKIHIVFTDDDRTATRAKIFNKRVFQVQNYVEAITLFEKFVNSFQFFVRTRPTDQYQKQLPNPYLPRDEKTAVIFQVDNFQAGGMEQVIIDLMHRLNPECYETYLLICGQSGDYVNRAQKLGLRIVQLNQETPETHYRQLLSDLKPVAVNAHYSLFGARIAYEMGVRFIQTIHNSYVWLLPKQIEEFRSADQYTDTYICVSPQTAGYADIKLGLDNTKIVIIENGLDYQALGPAFDPHKRQEIRTRLNISETDFVFLNVASIYPPKGQLTIIRAVKQVVRKKPAMKMIFLGKELDSAYVQKIRQEIKNAELEPYVIFAGYHETSTPFYHAADAFLLPSYWEGWSLALGEALYFGLPVIVTSAADSAGVAQHANWYRRIELPYTATYNINYENLDQLLNEPSKKVIDQLATAMIEAIDELSNSKIPRTSVKKFDLFETVSAFEKVIHRMPKPNHTIRK